MELLEEYRPEWRIRQYNYRELHKLAEQFAPYEGCKKPRKGHLQWRDDSGRARMSSLHCPWLEGDLQQAFLEGNELKKNNELKGKQLKGNELKGKKTPRHGFMYLYMLCLCRTHTSHFSQQEKNHHPGNHVETNVVSRETNVSGYL